MAVPKRKHSNSRTNNRRSHDHVSSRPLTFCPNCSTATPTHTICPKCGHYMGRQLVEINED